MNPSVEPGNPVLKRLVAVSVAVVVAAVAAAAAAVVVVEAVTDEFKLLYSRTIPESYFIIDCCHIKTFHPCYHITQMGQNVVYWTQMT